MEDVATTMMGEFAKRLESEIGSGSARGPAGDGAAAPTAEAGAAKDAGRQKEPEALDVGNVLANTPTVRYAGIAGLVLLLVLVLLGLRRGRKRQLTLNLNLNR
jgi:hypothetical protein